VTLFGTDGIRGIANRDVTAELALDVSVAAAHVLSLQGVFAGHRATAVVGRDTRASGEFLEAAVVAGLASAGVDVLRLGVIPTPAVAHLTRALYADVGVVLSASHNAAPDNGIKLFARGGHKLDDDIEAAIEKRMREPWERPIGAGVGRVRDGAGETETYVAHLTSTVPCSLQGLKVVLDCAHGAAWDVGPRALRRVGAEVVTIGVAPDGLNINDGVGSTYLAQLQQAVVAHGADAGIALDGDADRCLAVSADGEIVDGDQIMAVLALAMRADGKLPDHTVVGTVMSNLGFKIAMREAGITMIETAVGDRYVLEAMHAGNYVLGGEQSGHLIMLDHATTGDGLLTALQLLARMASSGQSLAKLASVMRRLSQVLVNVRDVDKSGVDDDPHLAAAVAAASAELGDGGRVLLRPSGTEPVVRVMVEAQTPEQAQRVAESLATVVRKHLG